MEAESKRNLQVSRRRGEKIFIGDDITLTILSVHENRVRLRIDAPGHIPVYREELLPLKHHREGSP